ncbi:hypothetical protein LEP1GSC202_1445 [Leptospira yanagawae serovar Saopaulo str. Sao Paulo = ATCC 700523]|uniref:Uncharacterized protein n=1 Tax=Leptospira yanagawae serovar Saopaulo str. Sao Paulo = ATCC 700523 TaxID=1249483 RepID=A0A5E8HEJ5_9LEPT|nr:hypothetical protein LEP1GSC202_1445 [Leptospira yanagawae serovar Saopaulo str. Sao Paulo = ATCC 700523]
MPRDRLKFIFLLPKEKLREGLATAFCKRNIIQTSIWPHPSL